MKDWQPGATSDCQRRGGNAERSRRFRLIAARWSSNWSFEPQLVRSLATRLARYVQGSLADLFSGPIHVELDTPLTVLNVAGLSENLRVLGIHLISNFVWTKVRRDHVLGSRRPLQLVVDELWWTLRSPGGGQFLDLMARKARKYWLGLVCASQSPADCLESHCGQAIVNNSRTWVLLGLVTKALEAARIVMKLTDREAATLEHAQPGQALARCRMLPKAVRLFLTVRASAEEEWINSTTPAELAERNRERRARQPAAASATPDPAPAFPTFRPTSSALR